MTRLNPPLSSLSPCSLFFLPPLWLFFSSGRVPKHSARTEGVNESGRQGTGREGKAREGKMTWADRMRGRTGRIMCECIAVDVVLSRGDNMIIIMIKMLIMILIILTASLLCFALL